MSSKLYNINNYPLIACNLYILREAYRIFKRDLNPEVYSMDRFYVDMALDRQRFQRFFNDGNVYLQSTLATLQNRFGMDISQQFLQQSTFTDSDPITNHFVFKFNIPRDYEIDDFYSFYASDCNKSVNNFIKEKLASTIDAFKRGERPEGSSSLYNYWSFYVCSVNKKVEALKNITAKDWINIDVDTLDNAIEILEKQLDYAKTVKNYNQMLNEKS